VVSTPLGFIVLTELLMKRSMSWDITRCSQLKINRRFGRKYFQNSTCYLLHAGFLLGLFYDTKNRGDMILRNVSLLQTDYTVMFPRRQNSSVETLCFLFGGYRVRTSTPIQALLTEISRDFHYSIQAMTEVYAYITLQQDRFFPNPFQFIIH
jgi:hypothetical protein